MIGKARHGRAWPGHPHLSSFAKAAKTLVDGPNKSGHDVFLS
jgi:hypothetical protein